MQTLAHWDGGPGPWILFFPLIWAAVVVAGVTLLRRTGRRGGPPWRSADPGRPRGDSPSRSSAAGSPPARSTRTSTGVAPPSWRSTSAPSANPRRHEGDRHPGPVGGTGAVPVHGSAA